MSYFIYKYLDNLKDDKDVSSAYRQFVSKIRAQIEDTNINIPGKIIVLQQGEGIFGQTLKIQYIDNFQNVALKREWIKSLSANVTIEPITWELHQDYVHIFIDHKSLIPTSAKHWILPTLKFGFTLFLLLLLLGLCSYLFSINKPERQRE